MVVGQPILLATPFAGRCVFVDFDRALTGCRRGLRNGGSAGGEYESERRDERDVSTGRSPSARTQNRLRLSLPALLTRLAESDQIV